MPISNHALGEANLETLQGIAHLMIVIDPPRTDYATYVSSRRLHDLAAAHKQQAGGPWRSAPRPLPDDRSSSSGSTPHCGPHENLLNH